MIKDCDSQDLIAKLTEIFERERLTNEIKFVRCDFTKVIKNISEVFNQFPIISFENCYFKRETNPFNNVDNARIEILSINGCGLKDSFITACTFSGLKKLDLSDNELVDP